MSDFSDEFMRIQHGMMNKVYRSPDNLCIYKVAAEPIPGVYASLSRESAAYEFLAALYPELVPRIFKADLPHSLLVSLVKGEPLSELTFSSQKQRDDLIFSLGRTLGKIHSIEISQAPQSLDFPFPGRNWGEQVLCSFVHISEIIKHIRPSLAILMDQCQRKLETNLACLQDVEKSLVHGDFGGANILIDQTTFEVTGVVDWEWATIADPDLDLVRSHWLDAVGRSARLWTNLHEQEVFYQGYRHYRLLLSNKLKFYWYGLWFATSYLISRLYKKLYKECDKLVAYLKVMVEESW